MAKSPFPGMDPYLEEYWGDLHPRLITYLSDAIQDGLPSELKARIEAIPTEGERPTEGYLEIVDRTAGARVVTVIDVLSPTNKYEVSARLGYLEKQKELRGLKVSWVGIDLIRTGERVWPFGWDKNAPHEPPLSQMCVNCAWQMNSGYGLHQLPLRERLPKLWIPLRFFAIKPAAWPVDEGVEVDLQAILDQAYQNGRYDDIDYTRELDPPPSAEDAKWMDALLREHKKR